MPLRYCRLLFEYINSLHLPMTVPGAPHAHRQRSNSQCSPEGTPYSRSNQSTQTRSYRSCRRASSSFQTHTPKEHRLPNHIHLLLSIFSQTAKTPTNSSTLSVLTPALRRRLPRLNLLHYQPHKHIHLLPCPNVHTGWTTPSPRLATTLRLSIPAPRTAHK